MPETRHRETWQLAISFQAGEEREKTACEIVQRLAPLLRGILWRFYQNDASGLDDAMQATWERIFDKIDRCAIDYRFKSWCIRIALNYAINDKNKSYTRKVETWPALNLDQIADDSALGPDESLFEKERKAAVENALNSLGAVERELLIMRYSHGFKIQEIANLIGKKYGTVRNQIKMADKKIAQLLRKILK